MTSTVLNSLFSAVLTNQGIIEKVYLFDEVRDMVQGVEIRLKSIDMTHLDFKTTSEEDNYIRPDPFRRDVKGYVYLAIGWDKEYRKWWRMMIDGKVAQKILSKYPQILHNQPFDRVQKDKDEELFITELEEKFSL